MKDPAILFYTSDFLTGTMLMSDEQVGKYIKLLCLQHQKGRLSEKHMLSICKSYDEDIYEKFEKDHNGYYYNIRLEEEILRRNKYTESRRNNAKGGKKTIKKPIKAYAQHMETEDETINETINKKEIRVIKFPFSSEKFFNAWDMWKDYKKEQFKFKYQAIGEQSALNKLVKVSNGFEDNAIDIIHQSMENGWKGFFEIKTNNIKNGQFDKNQLIRDTLGEYGIK